MDKVLKGGDDMIQYINDLDDLIQVSESDFEKIVNEAIEFAINEKEYKINTLTSQFILEDITGRIGDSTTCEKGYSIIDKVINSFMHGYICPNCSSDNSETYIDTLEQNCLDCGYEWKLSQELADDMK